MVTHDLRMCQYVDRVFQMSDGKLVSVIADPAEIAALAAGGYHEPRPAASAAPAVVTAPSFPARVPEYVVAS
jgi:energy-coupling factor transporter ATP-binding protein EcfA2